MRGTDAWRARWRSVHTRRPVALLTISSSIGTVLQLATDNAVTDDARYWDGVVVDGRISAASSYGSTDVSMATMTFKATNARVSGGVLLSSVLSSDQFIGASVECMLWERNLSVADALVRFVGVVRSYSTTLEGIEFSCVQRRDWNRLVSPREVTRAEFPYAPEESVGSPLPTVIGEVRSLPFRLPDSAEPYPLAHNRREKFAGGNRSAQALVVHTGGRGDLTPMKVMVAGHKVSKLGAQWPIGPTNPPAGTEFGASFFFTGEDDLLQVVEPADADIFNNADGAGFTLPDDSGAFWYPVRPVDVAGDAENPRALLDPFNETAFCRLDWTSVPVKNEVYLFFPTLPNQGDMRALYFYIIYRSSADMQGCSLRYNYQGFQTNYVFPANTSIGVARLDIPLDIWKGATIPNISPPATSQPWDFRFINQAHQHVWRVLWEPTVARAGWVEILGAGLTCRYQPAREVIGQEKVMVTKQVPRKVREVGGQPPRYHSLTTQREVLTAQTELRGKWYANVIGMPDTATGRYSGTANGAVVRATDLMHLLLGEFGGVPEGAVVTEPGALGSFADARALMVTPRGKEMKLGLGVLSETDVRTALNYLMESSLVEVRCSEFDSRWQVFPWTCGGAATYTMPLRWDELLDPREGLAQSVTPDTEVVAGVTVEYGYDAASQTYINQASITSRSSLVGHAQHNMRDGGGFVVIADTNDKLDWKRPGIGAPNLASVAKTCTVPQNGYADARALGMAVTDAMRNETPSDLHAYACMPCLSFAAGVNDKFRVKRDDGTVFSFTIPGVTYASLEAVATAVTDGLASVGSGLQCIYQSAQSRFVVGIASFPTGWLNPKLVFCPATVKEADGWMALGFRNGWTPATGAPADRAMDVTLTATADSPRMPGTFYIGCANGEMDVLWRSGANGLEGTRRSIAHLCGFEPNSDTRSESTYSGACSVSDAESRLLNANALFGEKRPVVVDGRALYDSDTALEVRDRLVALKGTPRTVARFASEVHADVEVGDVLPVHAEVDAYQPFIGPQSDGSWSGKTLRVMETHQQFGSSWHTEVELLDLTTQA